MLIEFLETFVGAFSALIPDSYHNKLFFESILSIIILSVVCISCFIIFMIILHACFKIFYKK